MTIQTPQSSTSPLHAFLAFRALGFLGSLIDAIAERFLDSIPTPDWTALTGWCLTQAPYLPWP